MHQLDTHEVHKLDTHEVYKLDTHVVQMLNTYEVHSQQKTFKIALLVFIMLDTQRVHS